MAARLISQDDGADIILDRAMIIVGRHPNCDARLDSPRISRRHCCMTQDCGAVLVRDLGSTNGIRINGQRVETGWLRPGDELSIAHMRFRYQPDAAGASAAGFPDASGSRPPSHAHAQAPHPYPPYPAHSASGNGYLSPNPVVGTQQSFESNAPRYAPAPIPMSSLPPSAESRARQAETFAPPLEKPLADAVRRLLPPEIAEKCKIQVIVQFPGEDSVREKPIGAEVN